MKQVGRVQSVPAETVSSTGYFDDVFETFATASAAAGVVDRFFAIGGQVVRIRFAGTELLSLTRALTHLATEPGAAALTIFVWDTASTGVALPEPPEDVQKILDRREMCGVKGDRFHAAFDFADNMRLNVLDRQNRCAVHWVPASASIPFYESAAPFLHILHWWMRDHGHHVVHAGTIGTVAGGVLLGGKSGSGKSTTTLACLVAGLRSTGDDYTLLVSSDLPLAHTLYSTAKLEGPHLLRTLPALWPAVSNSDAMEKKKEKAVLYLHEHYQEALIPSFPVKAVVLPRIAGGTASRLIEVSPALGLAAIAPSTMIQLRWSGQDDFRAIAKLVQQVPTYNLELGTELGAIPELISGLLAKNA